MFAGQHIATSATVVSDGLWCFRATTIIGAEQAVNTLLSNLKTAIGGTYRAFDFANYAHRYLAEF